MNPTAKLVITAVVVTSILIVLHQVIVKPSNTGVVNSDKTPSAKVEDSDDSSDDETNPDTEVDLDGKHPHHGNNRHHHGNKPSNGRSNKDTEAEAVEKRAQKFRHPHKSVFQHTREPLECSKSVLFAVVIPGNEYHARAPAIVDTWAGVVHDPFSSVVLFTDERAEQHQHHTNSSSDTQSTKDGKDDDDHPKNPPKVTRLPRIRGVRTRVIRTFPEESLGFSSWNGIPVVHHAAKIMKQNKDKKWLMVVDHHTYVMVNNLCRVLSKLDQTDDEMVYLGYSQNMTSHKADSSSFSLPKHKSFQYVRGKSGIVLSRPLALKMRKHKAKRCEHSTLSKLHGADRRLWYCIEYVSGTQPTHSKLFRSLFLDAYVTTERTSARYPVTLRSPNVQKMHRLHKVILSHLATQNNGAAGITFKSIFSGWFDEKTVQCPNNIAVVIMSDATHFHGRVGRILSTWASVLPRDNIMLVTNGKLGTGFIHEDILKSTVTVNSFDNTTAILKSVRKRMVERANIEWVAFFKDQSFVFVNNLCAMLRKRNHMPKLWLGNRRKIRLETGELQHIPNSDGGHVMHFEVMLRLAASSPKCNQEESRLKVGPNQFERKLWHCFTRLGNSKKPSERYFQAVGNFHGLDAIDVGKRLGGAQSKSKSLQPLSLRVKDDEMWSNLWSANKNGAIRYKDVWQVAQQHQQRQDKEEL